MIRRAKTVLGLAWAELSQWWVHFRLRRQGVVLHRSASVKGSCRIYGRVVVGQESLLQSCELDGRGGLTIGAHVLIDQALVLTAQHNIDSLAYETVHRPVSIRDYAIIYRGAVVLPGVKIGRGAVIGAGSVVTRDVPDMAVAAGNPARVVRQRLRVHDACDLQLMAATSLSLRLRRLLQR